MAEPGRHDLRKSGWWRRDSGQKDWNWNCSQGLGWNSGSRDTGVGSLNIVDVLRHTFSCVSYNWNSRCEFG